MPNRYQLDRRELLRYAAMFGPAVLGGAAVMGEVSKVVDRPAKRYDMKKSINLWALPYPDKMSLTECLQLCKDAGFDGVELNFDLESDVSVKASEKDLEKIGQTARDIGIEISGLCSFLFWPYSLTSNDVERRTKGRELAEKMVYAAAALGTKNLLVVPGAVYIPWNPEPEPVANDVCWDRATEAIQAVIPHAAKTGVSLNMENIFANAFLMSPAEINRFVDQFESDAVGIHFDTGNIMQFQFPEHWIRQCGERIRNVHLKEYSKQAGTQFTLETFRPLLDGTTNWPAVLDAFAACNYTGYLTFEYFIPYQHWHEALVYHTSDALDRMLGRKVMA
ncbi:MAG: sugar phosphate isomerase/epimerase [Planctomycetaceae bacterium]|nr:sugar phosphate isomerase/epimerase [Planctomycetaceae bacterium]